MTDSEQQNVIFCNICKECLFDKRHILCVECSSKICLICFSKGLESGSHRNNHAFKINSENVRVFPSSTWSSQQEQILLELLNSFGFSNWSHVSQIVKTHSPEECRQHYIDNYFGGKFPNPWGVIDNAYIRNEVPYIFKFGTIDPPRKMDSVHFVYDSSAETLISDLITDWDPQYQDIGEKLNCALIKTYNHRLRERKRRHRIVRQHGLITPNRTKSWIARFYKSFFPKDDSKNAPRSGNFVSLIQLTTGVVFDRIIEGLQYEYDLRQFLNKLFELRVNGIQNYHCGRKYYSDRNIRISRATENNSSQWEWKSLLTNKKEVLSGAEQILNHCMEVKTFPKKRNSTPLNIIGLSNYEKLNEDERELCSLIRLAPEFYLQAKNLLMFENSKLGYLRLADARRLMKIDVNKTRVMYDFFLNHGFINSK